MNPPVDSSAFAVSLATGELFESVFNAAVKLSYTRQLC